MRFKQFETKIGWSLVAVYLMAGCEARTTPSGASASKPGNPVAVTRPTEPQRVEPEIKLQPIDKAGFDALLVHHPGKVVLVDFWATWCPVCREQFSHTVDLDHELGPRGLVVLSLACDDAKNSDQVLAFLQQQQATFQNLRSVEGSGEKTFVDFQIDGGALPHYKLYDRKGVLRRTFASDDAGESFSLEDIDAAVAELLAEG